MSALVDSLQSRKSQNISFFMTAKAQPSAARPATKMELRTKYLLETAARCFLEKGFEATSVEEIAKAARTSKGAFYRRFPTKEALFAAVVRYQSELMSAEMASALDAEGAPMETLNSFGVLLIDHLLKVEGMALYRIMLMEGRRFPELARIFHDEGPARTDALLARYFETQVRNGRLRKMDTLAAARQYSDLVVAELMLRSGLGIFPEPSRGERRRRVQTAVECFLFGYGFRDGQ